MKTRFVNTALPVALLGILGLSWEASVHYFKIPSYILPGPWKILKVMWQRMDLLAAHALVQVGYSQHRHSMTRGQLGQRGQHAPYLGILVAVSPA